MCDMEIISCWFSSDIARSEALGLGILLAVLVTLYHIAGLNKIVAVYQRKSESLRQQHKLPIVAGWYFAVTILLMLLLHTSDTCIWACVLYAMKLIPNVHDAFYFSANTYTSLGYGDVPLSLDWRELSPLMAISGLFTFACTTGQLFNVMGCHNAVVAALKAARAAKV